MSGSNWLVACEFRLAIIDFLQGALPTEVENNEEVVPSTKVGTLQLGSIYRILNNAQVPALDDFTEGTQVLATIMEELKAEWYCVTDGPCYVMPNGTHVPLTKFRLSAWASEIVGEVYCTLVTAVDCFDRELAGAL